MIKQKNDFLEEQRRDFSISLIETIKALFQKVLRSEKPLYGKELNDFLLSQAESDEERETLQEMFEENETYHNKLKEFKESGKDIDEWYDEEITKSVKQWDPSATPDDINKVRDAVAQQIDGDIRETIDALEHLNDFVLQDEGKETAI